MEHVKLATTVKAALVVFIQRLVCILDAGEVGDASVYSLQQVNHGKECAVECGDVIIIEGQLRSSLCDGLAVLDEFLDAADLREWRSHRTDTPCSDFLGMLGKAHALTQAAAAHMHNHLKSLWSYRHPALSQLHTLFGGEHIALT